MFRLLQQQRFPWPPGSFFLTLSLLAILGHLLPVPDNSGHLSGGILTIELGVFSLAAALVIVILALVRQPQTSPFARVPSTRLTRARIVRAIARAAVALGVGAALLCQGIGRSLIQNDSGATPNSSGVTLLVIAQICFFSGFAIGAFFRPFSLARVTQPLLRTLLWVLVVIEWIALFAASTLANGLGQKSSQTIVQGLPSLLFVGTTSLALIIGSLLLFRHALAQAEQDMGGPIRRTDWPRIFWDAGGAKIGFYGLALIIFSLGTQPLFYTPDPLWVSELVACVVIVIGAVIAPAPAPAILPSSAATNEGATMAGNESR